MGRRAAVPLRGRWVDVIDAMLAPAETEETWAQALQDVGCTAFPAAQRVVVHRIEYDTNLATRRCRFAFPLSAGASIEAMIASGAQICPAGVLELDEKWLAPGQPESGGFAITAHPLPGVASGITAFFADAPHIGPLARRLLFQLSLHLDSAHRLRLRPNAIAAVISDTGKLLHREPDAPDTALLTKHTRDVHRARGRSARLEDASAELWPALVEGRFSLVAQANGTRTEYLVLDNPPETHSFRALSIREVTALRLASQGISNKLVAYGLGVSPGAVTLLLTSAAAKIGIASRTELIRIAAVLLGDERAEMSDAVLTAADLEILDLLKRGLSNRQIAAARSRSVHTIANQVAALLRKTKANSRRDLSVRVARRSA